MHLAASKASGDLMLNRKIYAQNNIIGSLNILISCIHHGVKYFIFSSSAAVDGNPQYNLIDEFHPTNPTSYYGFTKLTIEAKLKWYSELFDLKYASLRYFNAAGYDVKRRIIA